MNCLINESEADPGEGLQPPFENFFFVILLDSSQNNNRKKLFLRRGEGYGSGPPQEIAPEAGAFHTIGVQGYFGSVQPPLSEIPGSAHVNESFNYIKSINQRNCAFFLSGESLHVHVSNNYLCHCLKSLIQRLTLSCNNASESFLPQMQNYNQ